MQSCKRCRRGGGRTRVRSIRSSSSARERRRGIDRVHLLERGHDDFATGGRCCADSVEIGCAADPTTYHHDLDG